MLVGGAVALGGVVFVWAILRAGPGTKPDEARARALRLVALGAAAAALAQLAVGAVALGVLAQDFGPSIVAAYARTSFALATLARVALGAAVTMLALALVRRPGGRGPWLALGATAVAFVASSASISHAMARLDHRPSLLVLDAVHQMAAAVWVGGLAHLVWHGHPGLRHARASAYARAGVSNLLDGPALRRFSSIAFASVAVLVTAGVGLSIGYVGEPGALLETAYGVMVLTKALLLAAILGVAALNFRLVRGAATREGETRLRRFVEVETGLAITVLFAAASLTSLPPAVDVSDDRATLAEVAARFTAMPPRLASPAIGDLLRETNPLAGGPETRLQIEREWSEFNHHWAGIFVLTMGFGAIAHRAGVRGARHWPLLLVGLAAFLFVRNDPEVWPLGPIGFWQSLAQPEILQHRMFMSLVAVFGIFEWMVRVGRIAPRPWGYVFPVLCAAGGGLLLTHSHTVFSAKEAFLMEVTHAPIGVLGAFAGWARWLELRLPEAGPLPGRLWPACLTAVGVLLIFYSEG
jgi:putative copper resistance protein D